MNEATTPKALTIAEVADRLSCSADQVMRLVRTGRLKAFDIGVGAKRRCLRIPESELDNLPSITPEPKTKPRRRRKPPQPRRQWV